MPDNLEALLKSFEDQVDLIDDLDLLAPSNLDDDYANAQFAASPYDDLDEFELDD